MFTLYSMQRSGNSYKVRLALAQLQIPYRLVEVDILRGESRTTEFLAKNPSGQVPLLEVAPGRYIAESNAILWYVAGGTPLAAEEDSVTRAEALRWTFFEQHRIESNIGAAHFWLALVKGGRELQRHALVDWIEGGYRALRVMENHLQHHRYFAADRYTIADIALYAYTHLAHTCDFDLAAFPAIGAWLDRMAAQPGHVLMDDQPAEAARREIQIQLAHANRVATIGQLTASIAHDVNQPIAATVTNAQVGLRWLGAEPPNLDEARQAFGRIVRDGNRAGAVVGRIRNLIKKAPPSDERVDINAAIREVVELTRSEAMKNGVLVQTELVEVLPLVRGDQVELQQVILNLILNALEAMSEMSEGSPELQIGAGTTESGDVLVAVRDSGPGLAPLILENLFKAFYTTKPNGLGLGLSICRSIIEANGGRLWASANAPRGAVFQFTLPAHPDIASSQ